MSEATTREIRLLSVTAPVLNEQENLPIFYERVCAAVDSLGVDLEIVLVDDGSTDGTPSLLTELAERDPRVKVVTFSRNFGYQAAVAAGLDHCSGNVVITIDADLQDPPELIPELIAEWEKGADVVYAARSDRRGESRVKLATARWFSALFAKLAELDIPTNVGDFRLLDRRAVDALGALNERNRFMRGMTVWVGFVQSSIPYERDPRLAGTTQYRWTTLLRISLDAIASFSHVPLQIATVTGFLFSFVAFLGLPYVVVNQVLGFYVEGVSTTLFVVLLLGGLQLITLGIIGEYISRIYDEVKQRPLYLVKGRHNLAVGVDEGNR